MSSQVSKKSSEEEKVVQVLVTGIHNSTDNILTIDGLHELAEATRSRLDIGMLYEKGVRERNIRP